LAEIGQNHRMRSRKPATSELKVLRGERAAMRVRCAPDVLIVEQLAGMVVHNHRVAAEPERAGAWGSTARGSTSTTGPWRVYRDSERETRRLSAEMELTPAARNRVVTGPEPVSDLEPLLR
jgi:hypothetical protein